MKDAYYFVIRLTENEHYVVSGQIKEYCLNNDLTPVYYRKFKTGHIPMYREAKIKGGKTQISKLKSFMKDNHITDYIEDDFWQKRKDEDKKLEISLREKYTEEEIVAFKKKWAVEKDPDNDDENMFFLS